MVNDRRFRVGAPPMPPRRPMLPPAPPLSRAGQEPTMAEPMAPKIVQSTGERQEQQLSAFEANLRRLQDQRAAAYSSGWEEGSHHGYVRGVGWGMVCGALAGGLAAALAALAASGGLQ